MQKSKNGTVRSIAYNIYGGKCMFKHMSEVEEQRTLKVDLSKYIPVRPPIARKESVVK